ncbi:MAG: hypothetical protein RSD22_06525 [Romboutsia sp.]
MPNVRGSMLFSLDRTIDLLDNLTPIPGVPITLFDTINNKGISILSDMNGKFEFINVPNGDYLLMETAGALNPSTSPVDFSQALSMEVPTPKDPDIILVTTPLPPGANTLDSLTPNTIILMINNIDLLNQYFVDGPVMYTPIEILKHISTGPNVINLADGGTFGFNLVGTPQDNTPLENPYPGVAPSFGYEQYTNHTPHDGYISLVNIETLNTFKYTWWNIVDHTTGDEVGNFLIINGNYPGQSIFTETISTLPSQYCAFSAWISNQIRVLGKEDPKFTVEVTGNIGQSSQLIYQETSNVIPTNTNVPEWRQVGAVFSSGDFETVTVNIISEGDAAAGNDYAIDDVELRSVVIDPNIIQSSKAVENKNNPDNSNAIIGDTLIYTISISNISPTYDLKLVNLVDTILNDVTLISSSVTGGSLVYGAIDNPIIISVGTIPKESSVNVSFEVIVNQGATIPVITNQATVGGKIIIDPHLLPTPVSVLTNEVNTTLDIVSLEINKVVSPTVSSFNKPVVYTIDLLNSGTVTANDVLFSDIIPPGISFVLGSVYINNQNKPSIVPVNNTLTLTIPNILVNNNTSIKFSGIVSSTTLSSVINTATVNYNYINSGVVSPTITVNSGASLQLVPITVPVGSVTLAKTSQHDELNLCDTNIYTITISNETSNNLSNTIFYDTLPDELEYIEKTFLVNSINYNIKNLNNGVSLGTIQSNSQTTIKFEVKAVYIGTNPIVNNQACINYSIANNTISTCSNISTIKMINNENNILLSKGALIYTMKLNSTNIYTVSITNNNLTNLNNVVFYDNIESGLIYKPYSLTVNNINYDIYTLDKGVSLGTILAKSTVVIKFKAKLVSARIGNTINNKAYITYNNCNIANLTTIYSNICSVNISLPSCDY